MPSKQFPEIRKSVQTRAARDCYVSWQSEQDNLSRGNSRAAFYEKWRLSLRNASVVTVEAGPWKETRRVEIDLQPGKKANVSRSNTVLNTSANEDVSKAVLLLPNEDLADHLAKAVVHAIELCGGGENDPFK